MWPKEMLMEVENSIIRLGPSQREIKTRKEAKSGTSEKEGIVINAKSPGSPKAATKLYNYRILSFLKNMELELV